MKYLIPVLCSLLVFTSCKDSTIRTNAEGLELKIVAKTFPNSAPLPVLSFSNQIDNKLFVTLTNNSNDTIRIWDDDCSWGFSGLQFEFELPNKKRISSEHIRYSWDSNYPRCNKIPPNGVFVFHVNFGDSFWTNIPIETSQSKNSNEITIKTKAIYEIAESKDSQQQHIWSGRLESSTEDFILYF